MNLVPDQLTLDNSAQEPIRISGWIQSHGVLLAFDRSGVLLYRSSNAVAVLGQGVAVAWRLAGQGAFRR